MLLIDSEGGLSTHPRAVGLGSGRCRLVRDLDGPHGKPTSCVRHRFSSEFFGQWLCFSRTERTGLAKSKKQPGSCDTACNRLRRIRSTRKKDEIIIEWPSNGHDGGAIAFGKDGMLYVTSGDGTSDSDTDLVGQSVLITCFQRSCESMSTILDEGRAYAIPRRQPFCRCSRRSPRNVGLRFSQSLANRGRLTDRVTSGSETMARTCGSRYISCSAVPTTVGARTKVATLFYLERQNQICTGIRTGV